MQDYNPADLNAVIARIDNGVQALTKTVEEHHTTVIQRMDKADKAAIDAAKEVALKLAEHDKSIIVIDTATKTKTKVLGTTLAVVTIIFGAIQVYHEFKH